MKRSIRDALFVHADSSQVDDKTLRTAGGGDDMAKVTSLMRASLENQVSILDGRVQAFQAPLTGDRQ
jgi:hypothetical protein